TAVITCPKCSKDNQDHYKFCLGCGAELPRDAAPKPFSPQTPPQGMRAAQPSPPNAPGPSALAATAGAPPAAAASPALFPKPAAGPAPARVITAAPPAPAAAAATAPCPQCGHGNSAGNLFCGSCGFRLTTAARAASGAPPAPVAPTASGSGVVLTALRADGS